MFARIAVAGLVGILSTGVAIAVAEEPNINPGLWEYTNTMTFESEFPIPDQTNTSTECVTAEDVAQGDAFIEEMEGCELTRREMRYDSMDYVMECTAPDGSSVVMNARMEFHGDSSTGTISGDMETPMGPMKMKAEMDGRRIGEC
ncbi:MAG: DUF3617 domain-containing protein [Wenzhouxiangella sp.]